VKIVIIGTAYPLRGGIAHYIALLYHHLQKRHDVEIVTFSRQYPAFLFPGKSQQEEKSEGVQISTEQLIDSINPLTWIRAARAIAGKKPDLIIFKYWLPFFGPCFGVIARLVKRWSQARVLLICDNVIPHERRPGDKAFTRFAFRTTDFFIVQSRAVEQELKEFLPSARCVFVPHPVYEMFGAAMPKDEARRKLGLAGDERILLFFGYVRRYKGLRLLLEAMPTVLKSLSVKLFVVGEFYDDESKYKEQITSLGLEDSVTIRSDYVPNDEVRTYFSASDVVLLPYTSATQSGIAQIAYHFDKPVIATDVGGLAEVVRNGETGFVAPPNDPEALAQSILRFYRESREQEFVRNVSREKKKYTWDALVNAIEELTA
jgi:glycosyltransferase involved in cell wall biosynthesis